MTSSKRPDDRARCFTLNFTDLPESYRLALTNDDEETSLDSNDSFAGETTPHPVEALLLDEVPGIAHGDVIKIDTRGVENLRREEYFLFYHRPTNRLHKLVVDRAEETYDCIPPVFPVPSEFPPLYWEQCLPEDIYLIDFDHGHRWNRDLTVDDVYIAGHGKPLRRDPYGQPYGDDRWLVIPFRIDDEVYYALLDDESDPVLDPERFPRLFMEQDYAQIRHYEIPGLDPNRIIGITGDHYH